jgi:carboxyl-terminal processing protease
MLIFGAVMGIAATLFVTGEQAGQFIDRVGLGSPANAAGSETYRQLNIFGDVFERIRSQYVKKPEEQKLIKNAINGMLSSLDPHSSYLDAKEQVNMRVQTKGEFGGLGIEVTMEKELIKVITPIDDTPASKAGVIAGDLISKIDGENVRGLSLQQAVEKMRGLVNTPIVLTVLRKGADKPIEITIVRAIIKIKSVRFRVEGDDVGYIRMTGFTEQTYSGLQNAISKIKAKLGDKVKGYVLDLRLNPGGLLDQSVSVSDAFLDRGEIVSTRGRNPEEGRRYNARPGDETEGKPVIVLINGGSASASEIVAGALQDHRRATILGTRSFGKGSVQTIISLGANGALRLTTALYYTPAGRSIQGKGIEPDIIVKQPLPKKLQGKVEASGESKLRGHITGANEDDKGSGSFAYIPPEAKDDIQLNYALDLIRGIKKDASFPPDPSKGLKKKT